MRASRAAQSTIPRGRRGCGPLAHRLLRQRARRIELQAALNCTSMSLDLLFARPSL
jgi:hypothetical protein